LFVFVLFVFLLPLVANKDVHYRILQWLVIQIWFFCNFDAALLEWILTFTLLLLRRLFENYCRWRRIQVTISPQLNYLTTEC